MKNYPKFLFLASCLICLSHAGCDDDTYYVKDPVSSCTKYDCDPAVCGNICASFEYDENDEKLNDPDGDGIVSSKDNCPSVYNPDQKDSNNNGVGDACESEDEELSDTDNDTIPDVVDNCVSTPNPDQADSDGDGEGDACEEQAPIDDLDGDTIPDTEDNCPNVANPDQKDSNNNGKGDACDTEGNPQPEPDTDGDTIPDSKDNCPNVANPDQKDSNNNGKGDACDTEGNPQPEPDTDGDTIPDSKDNCPNAANPDQKDSNNNGKGDACDTASETDTNGDGSLKKPFIIKQGSCGIIYKHTGDTSKSTSKLIDVYPQNANLNESGPEYFYKFTIDKRMKVAIYLDSEPDGVDIDLHLLKTLNVSGKTVAEADFIARADNSITQTLDAGTYYIVADTYVQDGKPLTGKYTMHVDAAPLAEGTKTDPVLINCGEPIGAHYVYTDINTTAGAKSSVFNQYDYDTNTESGPEIIYKFTTKERLRFHANLRAPEPSGVDIDLQLLSSLDPKLIDRSDKRIWQVLEPGTYYLTADSYNNKVGKYILDVQFRPVAPKSEELFNEYILKAVNYLNKNWRKKGYGSSAYTHNLPYGSETITKGPLAPYTMCVAAVAETILVAMDLYAKETGDTTIWKHLPKKSWSALGSGDIKAHIWVNPELNAGGTGDAVSVFGMGMTTPFKELKPGSFINLNRSSGTGHAVVFISFIDKNCKEYETYNDNIIGFKYFSSQGSSANGGLDYRYTRFENKSSSCTTDSAIWPNFGKYAKDQEYLNTGMMFHPKYWLKTTRATGASSASAPDIEVGYFDEVKFNGITEK